MLHDRLLQSVPAAQAGSAEHATHLQQGSAASGAAQPSRMAACTRQAAHTAVRDRIGRHVEEQAQWQPTSSPKFTAHGSGGYWWRSQGTSEVDGLRGALLLANSFWQSQRILQRKNERTKEVKHHQIRGNGLVDYQLNKA